MAKAAAMGQQAMAAASPEEEAAPAAEAPPQEQMEEHGADRAVDESLSKELQRLQQLIGYTNRLEVVQAVNLLEAVTQGMCEMANGYKIFDMPDASQAGTHILNAHEKSAFCTRCFCAPFHSTLVTIAETKPNGGEVLLTLERKGLQCGCPQKIIGVCCICHDCCADGLTVYEGNIQGDPGDLQNAPTPLTMLKQPYCGGGFWPKLMEFPGGDDSLEPQHYFQGPCIFGGCSELCIPATFRYNTKDEVEIATLVHMVPKTIGDVIKEICTDSDKFEVLYMPEATMADKVTVLASAFLLDYMFFEMDNGMISFKGCPPKAVEFTCCFVFCCGILYPIKLKVSLDGGGSGEGDDDTE